MQIGTLDAWGNPLSEPTSAIGQLNPLRYRGYVYDQETGLYYLQSRYYNPSWGRFINADGYISTGQGIVGNNGFAYCSNTPPIKSDPSGLWTVSSGWNAALLTPGWGWAAAIASVWDDDFNVDLQRVLAGTGQNDDFLLGVASFGAGVSLAITNVDTVDDLIGTSKTVGFTSGFPLYWGVDLIYAESVSESGVTGNELIGVQFNAGIGFGYDGHYLRTTTESILPSSDTYRPGNKANNGRNRVTENRNGSFNERSKFAGSRRGGK